MTFESLRYFLEGCRPNKTVLDARFLFIEWVNVLSIRLVFHFLSNQRSSDLDILDYQLNYTDSKSLQYNLTVKLLGSSCLIALT